MSVAANVRHFCMDFVSASYTFGQKEVFFVTPNYGEL